MAAAAQVETPVHGCRSSGLESEVELLLACCRPISCAECLFQALKAPVNWDRVLRLAEHHRLLPALHTSICDRNDVPRSIQSLVGQRFHNNQVRALRFSAELARIVTHFADSEIDVLVHKGPALSQILYRNPAMRQFGDLDLLVRTQDLPRAKVAMRELGYQPQIQLSARQESAYLRSGYESVFGTNAERNLVELQWQVLPRFYSIGFDMDALFARSMEFDLDGLRLRSLGREDLVLVLCVHAAKHQWAQLGMVRDIATLARFDLDWDGIEAEARQLGILRILAISLLLARNLLALNIPKLSSCQGAEELAAALQSAVIRGVDPEPESAAYFRVMMRLRERWRDRARLIWRLATTPSVGEWQTVRLPDVLFPLYRGVRGLRLSWRLWSRT